MFVPFLFNIPWVPSFFNDDCLSWSFQRHLLDGKVYPESVVHPKPTRRFPFLCTWSSVLGRPVRPRFRVSVIRTFTWSLSFLKFTNFKSGVVPPSLFYYNLYDKFRFDTYWNPQRWRYGNRGEEVTCLKVSRPTEGLN